MRKDFTIRDIPSGLDKENRKCWEVAAGFPGRDWMSLHEDRNHSRY